MLVDLYLRRRSASKLVPEDEEYWKIGTKGRGVLVDWYLGKRSTGRLMPEEEECW